MKRDKSVSLHLLFLLAVFLTAVFTFILPAGIAKAAVTGAPTISATVSGNTVSVTATAVSGANKYRYQISQDPDFFIIQETKNKNKLNIKFTDLDYSTVYYVRVRGFYKADGGKEFGPWSSIATVTTGAKTAAAPAAPTVKVKNYIMKTDILSLLGMTTEQVKNKYLATTTMKVGSVSGLNTIELGNPKVEMYFNNKGCFFLSTTLSTLIEKTVPQLTSSKLVDDLGINGGYIGECQELKEADPKKSVLEISYTRNYGTVNGTLYIYGVAKDANGNILYDGNSAVQLTEGITNFSTVTKGYSGMLTGFMPAG